MVAMKKMWPAAVEACRRDLVHEETCEYGREAGDLFEMKEKSDMVAWKKMWPAAVEACRRDLVHEETCEYDREAGVSFEVRKSSICGCGVSMDVEDFPTEE